MRIAIVGAGAIGSNLGGPLRESGHEVLLIDQWPAHVEAIRNAGLRLGGTVEERTVAIDAIHLHEAQAISDSFDVVFIAVKSYDTAWATTFALRFLRDPDGIIVSCQNGLNDATVARIAGAERTLGCVVTIAAGLQGPGNAVRWDAASGFKNVHWTVGELDGADSGRAHALADVLSAAGASKVTTNLSGQRWSKLAANCMLNGLSGLTGAPTGEIWADARTRPIAIQLAAEAIRVATALGHRVEPIAGIEAARFVDGAAGEGVVRAELDAELERIGTAVGRTGGLASALQDVLRGRRTEIGELNGVVAREGRRLGLPVAFNEALALEFERRGTGFAPDIAHLEPLSALIHAPSTA